jgi:hypothetical protein
MSHVLGVVLDIRSIFALPHKKGSTWYEEVEHQQCFT